MVQLFHWSLFKYIQPHFYYMDQQALKQDWQTNHGIFHREMKVEKSLNFKEAETVTSVCKVRFPPSIETLLQCS